VPLVREPVEFQMAHRDTFNTKQEIGMESFRTKFVATDHRIYYYFCESEPIPNP
jgi:hypothetical protein